MKKIICILLLILSVTLTATAVPASAEEINDYIWLNHRSVEIGKEKYYAVYGNNFELDYDETEILDLLEKTVKDTKTSICVFALNDLGDKTIEEAIKLSHYNFYCKTDYLLIIIDNANGDNTVEAHGTSRKLINDELREQVKAAVELDEPSDDRIKIICSLMVKKSEQQAESSAAAEKIISEYKEEHEAPVDAESFIKYIYLIIGLVIICIIIITSLDKSVRKNYSEIEVSAKARTYLDRNSIKYYRDEKIFYGNYPGPERIPKSSVKFNR